MTQPDLFSVEPDLPPGLRYEPSLIDAGIAARFEQLIAPLPFVEFQFHGFTGKRRVVSFGWKYDFAAARLMPAEPIPEWMLPLRGRAAVFAGLAPAALEQVLVTEYQPGAAIGWHKDKAVFDEVVGISFGAACTMRFRRPVEVGRWDRRSVTLQPGSAYLIGGEARTVWEHSIPPVEQLRYSVTFRSMRR
jgi:alkylated DNA repair dioxygenase AlkB